MIRAYGIRGLLGRLLSQGMDEFAGKLEGLADTAEVYGFQQASSILEAVNAQKPKTKIILYGHSMGAQAAAKIASQTERWIDLLVAFDPTWTWPLAPIGLNVGYALCFYGRGASLLGRGRLYPEFPSQTNVINIPSYLWHTSIDDDDAIQNVALDAVRGVVAPRKS